MGNAPTHLEVVHSHIMEKEVPELSTFAVPTLAPLHLAAPLYLHFYSSS